MSTTKTKHKSNVPGDWYCTDPDDASGEGCIACCLCYQGAPNFFSSDENGNAFVKVQPSTASDIALCKEQMENCPVDSINCNG